MLVFSVHIGLQEVNTFQVTCILILVRSKCEWACGWKASICILCSYHLGNDFRLSMHMHTRTGEKPFICSICCKRNTMVHGCMAVWIHGKMDSWQFGFMAQWIHGSLDSWHYGWIAVWIHGTMAVWQFGCIVFSKTSPPPPAVVQNQNTLCTLTLIYSKCPKTKNSKTFWRLVIFLQMF